VSVSNVFPCAPPLEYGWWGPDGPSECMVPVLKSGDLAFWENGL
jgi:hypothetical protein